MREGKLGAFSLEVTPSQAQKDGVPLRGHSLLWRCPLADFEKVLPEYWQRLVELGLDVSSPSPW